MPDKRTLAIIGGGLSGLVAAHKLQDKFDVTLFEKSRGVGGRMSTRRAEPYQFDHGAQYFTARSQEFKDFLKPHIESGLVKNWDAKVLSIEKGKKPYKREWFEPHYVCAPQMNSLCKSLQDKINCHFSVEVSKLERVGEKWNIIDTKGDGQGIFDWVVMSVPSHQASILLPHEFEYLEAVRNVEMTGCYSVMLGFEVLPKLSWDIAMPKNSLISWIAVNSLKPKRETAPSILIQTNNHWADEHMDQDMNKMGEVIVQEFIDLTDIPAANIMHKVTHRWKYADTKTPAQEPFFIDSQLKIGVCGDWCIMGRVESAFTSADKLSNAMITVCK